jgi:hypothetical protein
VTTSTSIVLHSVSSSPLCGVLLACLRPHRCHEHHVPHAGSLNAHRIRPPQDARVTTRGVFPVRARNAQDLHPGRQRRGLDAQERRRTTVSVTGSRSAQEASPMARGLLRPA